MHRTHEMRMVRTAESGLEEWECPSCGRRILLRWPPRYVKHVLEHGDEQACHVARINDDIPDTENTETEDTAAQGSGAGGEHTRGARRWLRETGATSLHTPASDLNPAEPV